MKLLLRSLLLASLCASSSWSESSTDTVVVTQTPDVSVMEGDTVNISCCWTEKSDRTRINWWKQTEIKTKRYSFKNETQESQKNESSSCSTLIFSNITTKDSARYICRVNVEIPVLTFGEGNGTVITVTAPENKGDSTDHPKADDAPWEEGLIDVLRFLPILALVIAFFCLYSLGNKAHQQTPAVPRNPPPSAQRAEENQEDGGRDEAKQQEDQKEDEVNHETSDNSII